MVTYVYAGKPNPITIQYTNTVDIKKDAKWNLVCTHYNDITIGCFEC